METRQLQLTGMSCAACANAVERSIQAVAGVETCQVNFAAEQATVHYHGQTTDIATIQQAVAAAVMGPNPSNITPPWMTRWMPSNSSGRLTSSSCCDG
jgi:Cu+-exporting ATPase